MDTDHHTTHPARGSGRVFMTRVSLVAAIALLVAACGQILPPVDPDPDPVPPAALTIDAPAEPFVGDADTFVTLTGENIAGNATVTVDDTAAENVTVRGDDEQIVVGDARTGTSITFNPPELEPGLYDVTVSQGEGAQAESVTLENAFQYQVVIPDPVAVPFFLNAGGPDVDVNDVTWFADEPYLTTEGLTAAVDFDIAGTDDDVIYQTHRFSTNGFLSYVIPVDEAGTYDVTLHFAETFYGQPGNPAAAASQRVFNVLLQNEAVLEEFDLYLAGDGEVATAITETFTVTLEEGEEAIEIVLSSLQDRAMISAIDVQEAANTVVD